MTQYGVTTTGYNRKPVSIILSELESAMVTEFGPGVIQTPQSPLGQLNGLMADIVSELWELAEDVYQSYDPDQAEGNRLDTLARLRLISRASDSDQDFRKAITNLGVSRVDVQDLTRAVRNIDGVEFVKVFLNETGEVSLPEYKFATISIAVIGGDDDEIANAVRLYTVPGVSTYGNHEINSNIDGYCRSMFIIRPVDVPVELNLVFKKTEDQFDCPPPSPIAVREFIETAWKEQRINGLDPSPYTIRSMVECQFGNLELTEFRGGRDDVMNPVGQKVEIAFIEIASILADNVQVEIV